MSLDKMPINGFDLVLLIVLSLSIVRGRKVGMSGDLMSLLMWLVLLGVCALAYEPVGNLFSSSTGLFSLMFSYVVAYVGLALVVVLLFAAIKRGMGDRLTGSDMFGGAEYYLGMGSGLVRGACILLAGLALLNARYYSAMEVRAMEKFQNDVYGSNFFPTLQSVQAAVFQKSLTGPWIKDHLDFILIKPTQVHEMPVAARPEAKTF